jgi:hypothetical protein
MSAISQVIPNLLGGVSQQPDPLKLPGQVREAKNVLLDPTFGCRKRPPTEFIAKLASNIPKTAKWFPIFRDENERYITVIYKDATTGNTVLRVWEADTGEERDVTILGDAANYLAVSKVESLKPLTINDYTILCNSEKTVSMSQSAASAFLQEALVVVNQVAYNTTYSVDFLKDGQSTVQQKVWKAAKLSISPGSFEDLANGNCTLAGSQSYNQSSGSKTGLGFTITTSCNPTLITDKQEGSTYPTQLAWVGNAASEVQYSGVQTWGTYHFGSANNHAVGSYLYRNFTYQTSAGTITVRVEIRVEKTPLPDDWKPPMKTPTLSNRYSTNLNASIVSYTSVEGTPWETNIKVMDIGTLPSSITQVGILEKQTTSTPFGTSFEYVPVDKIIPAGSTFGLVFTVSTVQKAPSTPVYTYKSVYSSRVTLNNGGQGWRTGDSVNVQLNGKTYTVTVEEEDYTFSYSSEHQISYTTPLDQTAGALSVSTIVSTLAASINALAEYSATPVGNVIYVKRDDTREFNIMTRGGTANNALTGIKGQVNDVSMLPAQCVAGVVLKVRNTADAEADDYYVKFVPSSSNIPGAGSWEETVKPGTTTDLNNSTMPHALIREANGDFTVRPLSSTYDDALFWSGREVGDEKTNPDPSFVGRKIKEVFFFMNRLGFLADDAVVLSQPGDYFNFFVGSAIAVSDADPIDMTASATKPAILKAAIGTSKGLLLFAENSQFLLATTESAFGPSTVKMTEIANYAYTSNIKPLETGVSVMFSTEANTFSKVFEMAVDSIDNRPLVADNTRIAPEYIPPDLTLACSSPNNSLVAFGNDSDTLWIFKFFNSGNERSLAGWCKWVLPAPVRLFDYAHDSGYIVMRNGSDYILCKLEMLDDPDTSPINAFGSKFVPRLDNYLLKSKVVTQTTGDFTKVRFPSGSYVAGSVPNIILTVDGVSTVFQRPAIQQDGTGYYVVVPNSISEKDFILGLEYNMSITLPSFWVTSDKRSDRKNIPIVETAYLDLYYSGRYTVTVDKTGYDSVTIDLDVTPSDIYMANQAALQETTSKAIPVFSRGDFVSITIDAPDPLPASITSYSWEGHYSNRGISNIR